MKPIDQTLLYERDGVGDCWRACIASILELPLEDVPNFGGKTSFEQWAETAPWLKERGLKLKFVSPWEVREEHHPQRFVMVEGFSVRGVAHVVIGDLNVPIAKKPDEHGTERNWVHIAHDPHPSRAGLRTHAQCVEFVPI